MAAEERKGPGIPSARRRRLGPVACIECYQHIPCNPCEAACPRGAITVGDDITGLPHLDEEKCNGCGLCMTRCPGLAIFTVDESGEEERARVSFPYEYVPLPAVGDQVACADRMGQYVTQGVVRGVRLLPAFDHTAIVTVDIPREFSMEVRSLLRGRAGVQEAQPVPGSEETDEDAIYVCRCEEVTLGDIRRAIAQGADSIRAIKLRTHAGMGVCQGMTCQKNIERILREHGIRFDSAESSSKRFPVRMVNIGKLAALGEEEAHDD